MNKYLSNVGDAINTVTSKETILKTQAKRKKMEKARNNEEKGKPHPKKKVQGMKRQLPHKPGNKEINQTHW